MTEKKKRRNIYIHRDHIEDLDETRKKLEANRKEAVSTGYVTDCMIRNTKRHRDLLLRSAFVREKCKSGAIFIFKVVGKDNEVMLQPVPVQFMNRTAINHITRRSFRMLRRYGYSTDMHGTPEASTVLYNLGLSPMATSYRFRLEEYRVQDQAFGETFAYKFIPLSLG